jgi:hypothetical protein
MIRDPNWVPIPRDPGARGPQTLAEVILREGQLKEGHVQGFTIMCDEQPREGPSGGTGAAPGPLSYFALGMGF